jgi:hypothetical protein
MSVARARFTNIGSGWLGSLQAKFSLVAHYRIPALMEEMNNSCESRIPKSTNKYIDATYYPQH